jgi:hypothetical protein
MSLKENVDFVKDELNSEEKFIEGFVKVEKFYKKFKALIIGLSVIIVVAIVGLSIKSYTDEQNRIASNIAFDKVIENPKDQASLDTLKNTNNKLYQVALYINSKKEGKVIDTNIPYLKELSQYQKALSNKSVEELSKISMQNKFLLKEFAIFNKALILTKDGKYKEARIALNLIPASSKASELSNLLKHYLLTK